MTAAPAAAVTVDVLVFDGCELLDALGPFEVLSYAGLSVRLVTRDVARAVRTSQGVVVLADAPRPGVEWLVVPGGGWDARQSRPDNEATTGAVGAFVRAHADRGRPVAAVCTGALWLADAGLLRGRTATTHHAYWDELDGYGVTVTRGARVVDDGEIVTSGGITSGLFLGLHLVQRLAGPDTRAAVESEVELPVIPRAVTGHEPGHPAARTPRPAPERVRAGVLDVAYERHGPRGGPAVVLLHGFPYDPRCYDEVAARLAAAGCDVVVPYLRGYGPTRFVGADVPRSGQQAALAHDLRELIDALGLAKPVVAGYDWGGRAACLVAALWPEWVAGLVTVGGYNVQDLAHAGEPASPATEATLWYQYYLHGERGVAGLRANRADFARLLWRQWSPTWSFTDAQFAATAPSFDNPDFVDVVVHSYRHRYGLAADDPAYAATERRIAAQPAIEVPTVVIDPVHDGLGGPDPVDEHRRHFPDLVAHELVDAGHNPPQEVPAAFADAVLRL